MSFRQRIHFLLVHTLGLSNQEAKKIISSGELNLNGKEIFDNIVLGTYDKVIYKGEVIHPTQQFFYYAYNKPIGIECSMRKDVEGTLGNVLPAALKDLGYCGRLDKASEGLMLFTNDGHTIRRLTQPGKSIWKRYEVVLEKPVDEALLKLFENGTLVAGKMSLPARVKKLGSHQLAIFLQEGKNKQIRRMCYTGGNYVCSLKRTDIGPIQLGQLKPLEFRILTQEEMLFIRNLGSI
ncbi:MAG: rRNA pseudouridine synthase [Bacteroidetes bacterium]|nr:rRNA pseudouridine synthase [Bacteroidota bacterium]